MTGDNRRFVDTNVLVYANLRGSMHHSAASMMLQQAEAAGDELWISSQIMREYLAVVTRPQPGGPPPLTMSAAVDQVRLMLQRFQVVEDGPDTRAQLLTLLTAYPVAGRQVHDANIVATMLANGITRLLTFNVADFRRFAALITVKTL
jgi:predicted nucleic acid-binding protein